MSKLIPVAANWMNIGLALRLEHYQLIDIEATHSPSNNNCLREMLSLWLKKGYDVEKYEEPTWQKLSEAVRHPAGGNSPIVADSITTGLC